MSGEWSRFEEVGIVTLVILPHACLLLRGVLRSLLVKVNVQFFLLKSVVDLLLLAGFSVLLPLVPLQIAHLLLLIAIVHTVRVIVEVNVMLFGGHNSTSEGWGAHFLNFELFNFFGLGCLQLSYILISNRRLSLGLRSLRNDLINLPQTFDGLFWFGLLFIRQILLLRESHSRFGFMVSFWVDVPERGKVLVELKLRLVNPPSKCVFSFLHRVEELVLSARLRSCHRRGPPGVLFDFVPLDSINWIFLKHFSHDVVELPGKTWHRLHFLVHHLGDQVFHIICIEGRFSGGHLKKDAAERPEVRKIAVNTAVLE